MRSEQAAAELLVGRDGDSERPAGALSFSFAFFCFSAMKDTLSITSGDRA